MNFPIKSIITFLLLLFSAVLWSAYAQIIRGEVSDAYGALYGVNVYVKGTSIGTQTNAEGNYTLKPLKGNQVIVVSYTGYATQEKSVVIKEGETLTLDLTLAIETNSLKNVEVFAKTEEDLIEQGSYSVDVIQTDSFKNLSSDVNQVLKTTSGIIIRENGGLGSGFNLSLNGLSGNQIRYFIDGLPLENLGSSLTLNNFPTNLIERIDVYKGVVPIAFGSDALGGVINLITAHKEKSFLETTYSYGSFNTHRFTFNAQHADKEKGYFLKATSFVNHSDNNFTTYDLPVFDLELGNRIGSINIDRFNDQYTSAMLVAEAGIFNKSFADEWSLKLTTATNRNNRQHPDNNILRPLGELFTTGLTQIISTNYNKSFGGFSVKAYGLYSKVNEVFNDTSNRVYNWTGDYVLRNVNNFLGESGQRRSLFTSEDQILKTQVNLAQEINKNNHLSFNLTQNFLEREGTDTVNPFNESFKIPNTLNKNILGFSYDFKGLNDKINLSLFAKQYFFGGSIAFTETEKEDNPNLEDVNLDFSNTGYGAGISYKPYNFITIKASYEKGYRLPETVEILGDGAFLLSSPDLQPEISDNINAGYIFSKKFSKWDLNNQTNFFYRNAKDFIQFNSIGGPFSNYRNLDDVLSKGLESNLRVVYNRVFELSLNYTHQKITEENRFDEGFENQNFGKQVPNTPVTFWYIRAGGYLLQERLNIFWSTFNVDEFFLSPEQLGETNFSIPKQLSHNLDVDYSFKNTNYNVALSVVNLTDETIFDNFRIQKPVRAIYLKFRYFFEK